MPDIQLLTLDLDNTLWDVDAIIIRAEQDLQAWLASNAPDSMQFYTKDNLPEFRQAVVDAHPKMIHDLSFMRIEVLTRVMSAAGYGEREARSLATQAFGVFFEGRNRVEFFPGALESLEILKERYTLFALTNGNADIERAGLGHLLDGAISSADVGKSKPSKEMFHAPLEKLGLNPDQTKALCYSILTENQKKEFEEALEIDLAFSVRGVARFRANIYNQKVEWKLLVLAGQHV